MRSTWLFLWRASLSHTAKDTHLGHGFSILYEGNVGQNNIHVDLSPGTRLNVIHTRTKSLGWKWCLLFCRLSVCSPRFPAGWKVEQYCVQLISQHFYSFVVYSFGVANSAQIYRRKAWRMDLSLTALYSKQLICFGWKTVLVWYTIYFLFFQNMELLRLSSKSLFSRIGT